MNTVTGSTFFYMAIILVIAGCGPSEEPLPEWIVPNPGPREAYLQAFKNTSLEHSALYLQWMEASSEALNDTLEIKTPHQEIVYFEGSKPDAVGYRFSLEQGQKLQFVKHVKPENISVFVDLFRPGIDSLTEIELLGELEMNRDTFVYEAFREGEYVIRIQPELLVDCAVTVSFTVLPVYDFPVEGGDNYDIGSFFGDPRDGGRRKHKGVDVFARRGTPVVAISEGVVSRVREGGLGGKTVWVRDHTRSINQYYAHLDTQMVERGQRIRPGDTLGLVGNTGNARTTPPHLHFGLYVRSRGAVDPQPYISRTPTLKNEVVSTIQKNESRRSRTYTTTLYEGPDRKSAAIRIMPPHQYFTIVSESGGYYRVSLPDGPEGYIRKNDTEIFHRPLRNMVSETSAMLWKEYGEQIIPVAHVPEGNRVKVLAVAGESIFAEYNSQDITYQGWLH